MGTADVSPSLLALPSSSPFLRRRYRAAATTTTPPAEMRIEFKAPNPPLEEALSLGSKMPSSVESGPKPSSPSTGTKLVVGAVRTQEDQSFIFN